MQFSIICGNIVFVSKNYISVYFGWLWVSSNQLKQFGPV